MEGSDNHLPFAVILLLLLALSKAFGEIAERLKQPAMIGEIIAGCLLGPSLFNLIQINEELRVISQLGVFLLMILAGLEINPEELRKAIQGKSIWIALMSFLLPLFSGFAIGIIFQLDQMRTLFLALCISITALPVSVRILMDLGKLQTGIGQKIISAAIFNDIITLLILGIVLDAKTSDTTLSNLVLSVFLTLLKVIGFMILVVFVYRAISKTSKRIEFINKKVTLLLDNLKGKETLFALIIVFVLVFASISEMVGLHFVVGAFFGAMLLGRELLGEENFHEVQKTTSSVTVGFLAPVFFAAIGLEVHVHLINNIWLLMVVLLVAFASKIFGGYAGGRLAGLTPRESWILGVGLNGRGIMELVIANIALENGFIGHSLFSVLVLMGVITTIVTPFLLNKTFRMLEEKA